VALVLALIALAAPPAPVVSGPRQTTSTHPIYRFHARGAVGFICAFDTTRLHRCPARYSQTLTLGAHVLRVRAVGRRHTLSRVTTVRVLVTAPVPVLQVRPPVAVGPGAGVPATSPGSVWVPTTGDGMLVRVTSGTVAGRTTVGVPGSSGDLDTALAIGTRIWTASDAGDRIAAVDRSTGAVVQTIPVDDRPGGLVEGNSGLLYAFHLQHGTITRVDTATGTATRLQGPNVSATGIAYGFVGSGSLWLLTTSQLLELDPTTAAVRRTIPVQPPFSARHSFIETWWLAYGDNALWATLPNYDAVMRVDAISGQAQYFRLNYGRPFGVAIGAGSAWVATGRAVVRLDEHTGAILGAASLPTANLSGFVSIAFGYGSAWVTNYDRGTLTEVPNPVP
jgi:hypothetical protein